MQLETLTLTDIGTFRGKKVFDLAPRPRNGTTRPIVLFGGLNGAGKTTFLTAIRLALYGRQSMESGTSQRQYENFLQELIHRSNESVVRLMCASISLEFTYARLGERTRYRVLRNWDETSQGVTERLRVFRDADVQEESSDEQAQAFLNLMVPSGISQFFFFDGEKITAFARDDADAVLGDSIRRLLGLDLADRLSSDLSVYLRQRNASSADKDTQISIKNCDAEYTSLEDEISAAHHRLETELEPALKASKIELEQRRAELMDRGGAWAVDRSALERERDAGRVERKNVEVRIRESLAGVAIFALAPKLSKAVVGALKGGQADATRRALSNEIREQARVLKEKLRAIEDLKTVRPILGQCIDSWVAQIAEKASISKEKVKHEFSDLEARNAIDSLGSVAPLAYRDLVESYQTAHRMVLDEDSIQARLKSAPSKESIQEAMDALTKAAETVARLEQARRQLIEVIRRKIWRGIELTRQLTKLEAKVNVEGAGVRGEQIATSLQDLIVDFKIESAVEKCKTLERHFVSAFRRLSRKQDIVHDARVDSETFKVTLLNGADVAVPKKRLSAGEKQIYAIAMLEALAKTSGRNLPVIIDTPLGRLDSKHRHKLVESYFPVASHQVIILSTDTEVDAAFYKGLQPHISHGYHLAYDETRGATDVEKGYFWKMQDEKVKAHAA